MQLIVQESVDESVKRKHRNFIPETNIAPKIGHPKRKLVFQPYISKCYVSFREGNNIINEWLSHLPIPSMLHSPRWEISLFISMCYFQKLRDIWDIKLLSNENGTLSIHISYPLAQRIKRISLSVSESKWPESLHFHVSTFTTENDTLT